MIFAVVTNPCVGLTTVCIVQFVFMKLALRLLRFVYLYVCYRGLRAVLYMYCSNGCYPACVIRIYQSINVRYSHLNERWEKRNVGVCVALLL